jgi:uridine kinase
MNTELSIHEWYKQGASSRRKRRKIRRDHPNYSPPHTINQWFRSNEWNQQQFSIKNAFEYELMDYHIDKLFEHTTVTNIDFQYKFTKFKKDIKIIGKLLSKFSRRDSLIIIKLIN